jgi:CBS domain-containing protein
MNTVRQILTRKGREVYRVTSDTHVIDALHLLEEKNIGCIVVMQAGQYIGIMTERDYARKIVTKGKRAITTFVRDIMTTDLPHIKESDTTDYCMELMSTHNQRYLPVFNSAGFMGIISMTDLVKEKLIEQKEHIRHLESYIRNSY